ncbi:hypothetical protein JOC86_000082 [Bacillus pakistanensis]|uniref:Uncharacterized protein n=1 Tax=Rossellomorea pakistanensis TaxID=992288 RepID=A0ABS2N6W4_9BACI|nr:hypothetical protein [Bacillus pakistanensis]
MGRAGGNKEKIKITLKRLDMNSVFGVIYLLLIKSNLPITYDLELY